eukprot:IDg12103t1
MTSLFKYQARMKKSRLPATISLFIGDVKLNIIRARAVASYKHNCVDVPLSFNARNSLHNCTGAIKGTSSSALFGTGKYERSYSRAICILYTARLKNATRGATISH